MFKVSIVTFVTFNLLESKCMCADGWMGDQCEQNVNECVIRSPCVNGGVCLDSPGSYRCLCGPYWTGNNCQLDVEECDEGPCHNAATCIERAGADYTCICVNG